MKKFLVFLFLPFLLTLKATSFYQYRAFGGVVSGLSPCASPACKNLNSFTYCLRSEVSPYRYYGFRPQLANTPKAQEAYRRFSQTHPKCFQSFCQSVCTLPPKNYRPPASVDAPSQSPMRSHRRSRSGRPIPDFLSADSSRGSFNSASSGGSDSFDSEGSFEDSRSASYGVDDPDGPVYLEGQGPSRISRARKAFLGGMKKGYRGLRRGINTTHRWATRKYNERQSMLRKRRKEKFFQASRICAMNTPEGAQLRALCSACVSHLPPSYQIIPDCHVNAAGIPFESSSGSSRSGKGHRSRSLNTALESPNESFDSARTSASGHSASPSSQWGGHFRRGNGNSVHFSQYEGASTQPPAFQDAFRPRETRQQSASRGSQTASASQQSTATASRSGSAPSAASQSSESYQSVSADGFDDVDVFWDSIRDTQ